MDPVGVGALRGNFYLTLAADDASPSAPVGPLPDSKKNSFRELYYHAEGASARNAKVGQYFPFN